YSTRRIRRARSAITTAIVTATAMPVRTGPRDHRRRKMPDRRPGPDWTETLRGQGDEVTGACRRLQGGPDLAGCIPRLRRLVRARADGVRLGVRSRRGTH